MIKEYSGHRPLRHKPEYAFMPECFTRATMLMGYDITVVTNKTYPKHLDKFYRVYKRDDTNVKKPERFLGVMRTVHMQGHVFSLFCRYTKKSHVRNLNEKPSWFSLEYRPRLEKLLKSAQSFVPENDELVLEPDFKADKFVLRKHHRPTGIAYFFSRHHPNWRYDSDGDPEEYYSDEDRNFLPYI